MILKIKISKNKLIIKTKNKIYIKNLANDEYNTYSIFKN